MKRMLCALAAAFACAFPVSAYADAAIPSVWERGGALIWVLVIAIIVIVAAVLIFVLRKRRK